MIEFSILNDKVDISIVLSPASRSERKERDIEKHNF